MKDQPFRTGTVAAMALAVAACGSSGADELSMPPADGSDAWTVSDTTGDVSTGNDSYPGPDTGADASQDTACDGLYDPAPDVADDPAPDVPEDVAEEDAEEEPPDVCDREVTEPQVLYLSADDSNSQASPIIARALIENGAIVPSWIVRTYEFTNYFDISYTPAPEGRINVVAQMKERESEGGYAMQIGAQAHALAPEEGRPLNVTLVLDTSGSMSGSPISLERHVCRAIAASLSPGDVISMVTWDVADATVLDSHSVTGPDDPTVRAMCDSLESGGGTNLHGGLTAGYALATDNYDEDLLNRVVLVSDGQANMGVTDEQIIAAAADDEESEGIYLVGVGVGNGYNDTLMDAVTDAGKGAYVFVDSPGEAYEMFSDRFLSTMEIAVMDVRVELTLPAWLRIETFYGEEISTSPKEVEPQHLAPNDAMIFHQDVVACTEPVLDDTITVVARYTDPETRTRESDSRSYTVAELLETQQDPQLVKGMAVVRYAEGLKELADLALSGDAGLQASCDALRDDLGAAADLTADPELVEIHGLLVSYCSDVTERSATSWY